MASRDIIASPSNSAWSKDLATLAQRPVCPPRADVLTFDSSRAPTWIRFRIDDGSTMLTKANPEYHVSEVADWSEEKLYQVVEAVTAGLVGKSA